MDLSPIDLNIDLEGFGFNLGFFPGDFSPPPPPPGSNQSSPARVTQLSGAFTASSGSLSTRRVLSVSFSAHLQEGEEEAVKEKPDPVEPSKKHVRDDDDVDDDFQPSEEPAPRVKKGKGLSATDEKYAEMQAEIDALRAEEKDKEADRLQKILDRRIGNRDSAANSRANRKAQVNELATLKPAYEDLKDEVQRVTNLVLPLLLTGTREHAEVAKLLKLAMKK